MINKIILVILLVTSYYSNAQKLDAVRIEVPSDIDMEQFHVETIGEDGMLIFYESREVNKEKKRKWYFGLFDVNLQQQWLKFVPLFDKMEFVSTNNTNNRMYFLFKNINSERGEYGYYEIVIYDIKKQSFSQISGSIPTKANVAGFSIINNTACIALNLKKHETDIVFVDLLTGDVNPVNINKGVQGYIEALYADKTTNTFYVAIKQNKDRRYISDHLLSYSADGLLLSELKIQNPQAIKYFRDFTFVSHNENELLIFGTYDILTGRNLSFKEIEEENDAKNAGLFFMKINNNKQESLIFYDFMEFDNIIGNMRLNDVSSIKLPDDSVQVSKKNPSIMASFSLSEPDIIKIDANNYIFSADAYRSSYRTETRMDYDFYGRPYPYTYNVFNGYEFYDVIIAGISSDGDLLWNNDFEMNDIITYSTKRNSVVFQNDNFTTIAYVNNGSVVAQTINKDVDIDRSKMKIGTNFPQDKVSQDENNRIISWYGNYFLIYGYQKLKNRTLGKQATRMVFYANKITYR